MECTIKKFQDSKQFLIDGNFYYIECIKKLDILLHPSIKHNINKALEILYQENKKIEWYLVFKNFKKMNLQLHCHN